MGFKFVNCQEGCNGQTEVEAKHENCDFSCVGSKTSIKRGVQEKMGKDSH